MNSDSRFDSREFVNTPSLKLIEEREGGTCVCYQLRIHGKLHFVKKIKPEFENDPRMRAAFRKENEIGFSISHPNIPTYMFMEGIFSPEEYVVTEWIEGESLDNFVENNPQYFSDKNKIEKFILQVSDTLDYLHQKGIIHGDLKPSNIMLSRDGEKAFILDLGFCHTDSHQLTGGFSSLFTAPEVIEGKEVISSSDYYSLGKVIEFIYDSSGISQPKKIGGLQERLTSYFPEKRLKSKEEIEKALKTSKKRNIVVSAFLSLMLLSLTIGIAIKASTGNDNKNNASIMPAELIANQDSEPISIENVEEPENDDLEEKVEGAKIKEATEIKVNIPSPTPLPAGYSIEELKKEMEQEVKSRLQSAYAPLMVRIDSLEKTNTYTMDWYTFLYQQKIDVMVESTHYKYYEKKYPQLTMDTRTQITNEEFLEYIETIFDPKLESYYQKISK